VIPHGIVDAESDEVELLQRLARLGRTPGLINLRRRSTYQSPREDEPERRDQSLEPSLGTPINARH
jgi:hypothetical protein